MKSRLFLHVAPPSLTPTAPPLSLPSANHKSCKDLVNSVGGSRGSAIASRCPVTQGWYSYRIDVAMTIIENSIVFSHQYLATTGFVAEKNFTKINKTIVDKACNQCNVS